MKQNHHLRPWGLSAAKACAMLCAAVASQFMMTACSSSSDDTALTTPTQQTVQSQDPVTFDVYSNRSTTRAGKNGDMTTTSLQTPGFGVFAYYTDNLDYTPQYQPNFMYNEHVEFASSAWNYALTKYWPNEHGSAASSYDQDRVSFFAYAPYVNFDPQTGLLMNDGGTAALDPSDPKYSWGIVGTKRNTLIGDPIIQYIGSFDVSKSVDLCWGTTSSSTSGTFDWNTNSSTQAIANGFPWLNVRKPDGVASGTGAASKVKFYFQHATARLLVDIKTDNTTGWIATDVATATRVWVRSVKFTGMAQRGALNLNNPKTLAANKARWIDYYGQTELELGESVTVYDGRKNGSEATTGGESATEMTLGLNPDLVETDGELVPNLTTTPATYAWKTSGKTGVPSTAAVNLFSNNGAAANATTGYIYIIPTGETVSVEIEYDVETIDPKLATTLSDGVTPGSSVKNRIKKTLTTPFSTFANNTSYVLHLKLGMKDVKFDAEVKPWGSDSSQDVNLPQNN